MADSGTVQPGLATLGPGGWVCSAGWQQPSLESRLGVVEGAISAMPTPPVKYSKTGLLTNSSGVWTGNLGAGKFAAAPALQVTPKMANGNYDWRYQISGSAGAGFTATVTFTLRKSSIDIALVPIAGVLLTDPAVGAVTFDLVAAETTP